MAGTRSDPLVIVVELARWRFPGGNVGGGGGGEVKGGKLKDFPPSVRPSHQFKF